MKNEITRKTVITKALGLADVWTDEEIEVLNKIKASLDNKSSKSKKVVEEHNALKADILAFLADGRGRTATEVGNEIGVTCQKASSILRMLVEEGAVEKTPAKGKNPTIFVAIQ